MEFSAGESEEGGGGTAVTYAFPSIQGDEMATEDKDKEQIQALMDARVRALREKEVSALMRDHAPDIVSFDVVDPLQYLGLEEARQRAEEWFSSLQAPIALEMRDLTIAAGDEVAFCHSLNHINGKLEAGGELSMWVRSTVCFRKVDGEWVVTHEHTSVPFDTETGKASLGLSPEDKKADSIPETTGRAEGNYAPVNGLNMYYEVHGTGKGVPLVLLHGAFSAIGTSFGNVLPGLAATRKVIGVELQGHGHTADAERGLSYEQMADDTATLLRYLGIESADFFGYSLGAGVALQIAIRHPEVARKLALASVTYTNDGFHPGLLDGMEGLKPEHLMGSPWHDEYMRTAPRPEDFPNLVEKIKYMDLHTDDVPADVIRAIRAPILIIIGDSDIVRPEHAVELFRLLGGGVIGDNVGIPNSQLAVLPGTAHTTLVNRADWLVSMITQFLDAPMPKAADSE